MLTPTSLWYFSPPSLFAISLVLIAYSDVGKPRPYEFAGLKVPASRMTPQQAAAELNGMGEEISSSTVPDDSLTATVCVPAPTVRA
jgi:hypothetical protein